MATVYPVADKYERSDKTHVVNIRLSHKSKITNIPTSLYVQAKDMGKGLRLKKTYYNSALEQQVKEYRDAIAKLGVRVKAYDVEALKSYLLKSDESKVGKFIDFIAFCQRSNELVEKGKGKNGTWYANNAAMEWLKKYIGSETLNINDISKGFLKNFERYLEKKGVGDAGISSYFRALRTLFLNAIDEYNDESRDELFVRHYPFRKYKIREHVPEKRSLEADAIKKIRAYEPKKKSKRAELARDVFMLTFYLAGIAPIDLYALEEPKKGRIEYYREKVKWRANRVKVSILIQPEAQVLIEKYSKGAFLSELKKYATVKELSRAVSEGFKHICKELEWSEEITCYWSRHSFATIAINLGFDTNKVDFSLGHAPSKNRMAEVYIRRSKESVDEIIRAVIDAIK